MNFIDESIEAYCVAQSDAVPDYLLALERATHQRTLAPQMLSGQLVGRFLSFISGLIRPSCVVEMGTFTGYSSLCLAEGLADDGIVHTFEVNDELLPIINEFQALSPYQHKIQVHIGKGEEVFPTLDLRPDLAFIDAGKLNYLDHYEMIMETMKPGGVILVDNVLWSGKVVVNAPDDDTQALRAFNEKINADDRCSTFMLPIRDGLTLIRKL